MWRDAWRCGGVPSVHREKIDDGRSVHGGALVVVPPAAALEEGRSGAGS